MKRLLMIMLALLSTASTIITFSACVNLRDNTNFSETAETDIQKLITAKSKLSSVGVAEENKSSETEYPLESTEESTDAESVPVASDIYAQETSATEPPETAAADTEIPETKEANSEVLETFSETDASEAQSVDVDLTALSSTMVYAEVFNMIMNPNDYIGKTVKMRGAFGIGYSSNADGTINENTLKFACVVADATACCSQGIEFILSGEHNYPNDYPELGTEITVVGTFETYDDGIFMYFTLTNATMEV